MKRSTLLSVFVALLLISFAATDAMAMLNPATGRFMQRDPLGTSIAPPRTGKVAIQQPRTNNGFIPVDNPIQVRQYTDGMSLYQYVGSNPIHRTDAAGLKWVDTGIQYCDRGPVHGYIRSSTGQGFGFYAESHLPGQAAEAKDDVRAIGLVDGWVDGNDHFEDQGTCTEIQVNDACCDPIKFREAVDNWLNKQLAQHGWKQPNATPLSYNVAGLGDSVGESRFGQNCWTWRRRAIGAGLDKCLENRGVGSALSAIFQGTWRVKPKPTIATGSQGRNR